MTRYGGRGGVWGGRPLYPDDRFERDVNEELGDRIRADDDFAAEMWSALANIEWRSGEDTASYSYRAAGDMIAAIQGYGDYITWYCSGPSRTVSPEIAEAMLRRGWAWSPR